VIKLTHQREEAENGADQWSDDVTGHLDIDVVVHDLGVSKREESAVISRGSSDEFAASTGRAHELDHVVMLDHSRDDGENDDDQRKQSERARHRPLISPRDPGHGCPPSMLI
jgi:hypothetical protein